MKLKFVILPDSKIEIPKSENAIKYSVLCPVLNFPPNKWILCLSNWDNGTPLIVKLSAIQWVK